MHQFAYDQDLFWLNTANVLLGVVCLICFGVLAIGLFRELQVRVRRHKTLATEIDGDMRTMMGDGHAFNVPGLGLTMADGGQPIRKPGRKTR